MYILYIYSQGAARKARHRAICSSIWIDLPIELPIELPIALPVGLIIFQAWVRARLHISMSWSIPSCGFQNECAAELWL